jgi:hypothetical protein
MSTLQWSADRDGTAHAAHAAHPGHARTLCGQKAQDPRWAWPEQGRCADCQALEVWPSIRLRERRGVAV